VHLAKKMFLQKNDSFAGEQAARTVAPLAALTDTPEFMASLRAPVYNMPSMSPEELAYTPAGANAAPTSPFDALTSQTTQGMIEPSTLGLRAYDTNIPYDGTGYRLNKRIEDNLSRTDFGSLFPDRARPSRPVQSADPNAVFNPNVIKQLGLDGRLAVPYEAEPLPTRQGLKSDVDYDKSRQERLDELRAGDDPYASREERLNKREERLEGDREKNPWMALAKAGFAMASGTSPDAFTNIAAGAGEGMTDLTARLKDTNRRGERLGDAQDSLDDARLTLDSTRQQAASDYAQGLISREERDNKIISAENEVAMQDYRARDVSRRDVHAAGVRSQERQYQIDVRNQDQAIAAETRRVQGVKEDNTRAFASLMAQHGEDMNAWNDDAKRTGQVYINNQRRADNELKVLLSRRQSLEAQAKEQRGYDFQSTEGAADRASLETRTRMQVDKPGAIVSLAQAIEAAPEGSSYKATLKELGTAKTGAAQFKTALGLWKSAAAASEVTLGETLSAQDQQKMVTAYRQLGGRPSMLPYLMPGLGAAGPSAATPKFGADNVKRK
jgi:hypothetical protein